MIKSLSGLPGIAVAVLASAQIAGAAIADDWNWADDVTDYSSKIQNYAGVTMDETTTWWLTGPPDGGTGDYVGGWRSNAPSEYIVMHWETPIPDLPGDDLVIELYGGPSTQASVLASVDGAAFTVIGTISGGIPMEMRQELFDFDDRLDGDVSFVLVQRTTNGPQTGLFFDAFGGTEPLLGDVNRDGEVNGLDVDPFVSLVLSGEFQVEADCNLDLAVNGLDVECFVDLVVTGGGAAPIPEPSTCVLTALSLLGFVAGTCRRRNRRPR